MAVKDVPIPPLRNFLAAGDAEPGRLRVQGGESDPHEYLRSVGSAGCGLEAAAGRRIAPTCRASNRQSRPIYSVMSPEVNSVLLLSAVLGLDFLGLTLSRPQVGPSIEQWSAMSDNLGFEVE